MLRYRLFSAALMYLAATPAFAVDVEFEGAYQVRGRYYNSLSLATDADGVLSEGSTLYAEHRLWLRPHFLLSDKVRLTVDFKGLDNVAWGNRPEIPDTFTNPVALEEGLSAPVSDTDETSPLLDFTIWRAWGEVDTGVGRLSFGRMPLHWGSGIWQNDGMSLNAERGDTADRGSFETLVQESIFVRAAFDTHAENFVNTKDDTYALSLQGAYRSERVVAGMQVHYRHTAREDNANNLNLVTIDGAADAELGKLTASGEALAQFGNGDLPGGINDVNITGFGAVLAAELNTNPWRIRIEGGMATGDKDDTDAKLKTFAFDRDYNVGVMPFEQQMPVLGTAVPNVANQNRSFDQVLTGTAVANALYLKPTIARALLEGLEVEASALLARVASAPARFDNRKSYGNEIQAAVRYTGLDHLEVDARGALFLPGTYFRNINDDVIPNFDRPAFGVQLTTRIRF